MYRRGVLCLIICLVDMRSVTTQTPGVDQFWTDDQKIFEQIYGRTSDRDLYRALQLPLNNIANFGIDTRRFQLEDAIDKREKPNAEDDATPSASQQDSYLGHYNSLLQQQTLKTIRNDMAEPTKPSFKFVGYNEFRPISQNTNPEAYNYYKQLELLSKAQVVGFPQEPVAGFKPAFVPYANVNPEETDAYKSIQDILDAHEVNKERKRQKVNDDDKGKYASHQGRSLKKPPVRYVKSNDVARPSRCVSGRCRTRTYLVRRPVITRIKHRIISDD